MQTIQLREWVITPVTLFIFQHIDLIMAAGVGVFVLFVLLALTKGRRQDG